MGRNRLTPCTTEHTLLVHNILRLFQPFHRYGEDYYLVYSEKFDENSVSEQPSCLRVPNMEFVLSCKPQRDPALPTLPDPEPLQFPAYSVIAIIVDSQTPVLGATSFDSCNWVDFDTLSASLSYLGKTIYGPRYQSDVQLFADEDMAGDPAGNSDSMSDPEA
ncbi:hypothetical protein NM688_g4976 [Phlebia brevispora]|uniref:Uncharacterized protein n=1 Tax=Phlebia brevispora TaxID=194682 RepID=A0ACC1T1M9_9APHY|nr:hypothetical protein NM688_g4976 [Phlebia brevispora]